MAAGLLGAASSRQLIDAGNEDDILDLISSM
jgi:hypothetical protein